jgi:uncharacterized protein (TIGR01777 family)
MRLVLAGATGFLGRPLADALAREGHTVVVLTRRPGRVTSLKGAGAIREIAWTPDGSAGPWAAEINDADAVVNLAGESIAGRRWNAAHKARIRESRVLATRSIVAAIAQAAQPPAVLINGSASGFYGPLGDEVVTEETPVGRDFLARTCLEWETEALAAETARTRVVRIRTGLVLERDGGALKQMLPPFLFGLGGPVGSGRQYWPWIHRQDWIDLVRFSIQTPAVTGPINASAPHPTTNAEFTRALGRAIHRPTLLPAPGFALKIAFGEMADALLLTGQRMVPAKAERLGFMFTYPHIDQAFAAIFKSA